MNDPNYLLILGRIEGKLDTLMPRQDDLEDRVTILEALVNKARGYLLAVATAGAAGGGGLAALLNYLF